MRSIRTVLLVEDDPAWARLTREAFSDAAPDVSVEWCSTGTAALDRFEHRPAPDAVVLDLNLPDLGGMEVLQELRTRPTFAGTVVVVLSASLVARDHSSVAEGGGPAHCRKPTTYSELRDLADQIASGSLGWEATPAPDS